jgi:XRE family transcriptional regulator, regulator of sulfur utilization
MKLHERLAELRREHRITLRELRERIRAHADQDLSISYLSELERTETAPSLKTLTSVAAGYGISVGALLAPVGAESLEQSSGLPNGLRTLAEEGALSQDWIETLARIEFRGVRPESQDEWQAIYGVLKALMEPKVPGHRE